MKWFIPHPRGKTDGVLFDDEGPTRQALFLTPEQAKFMMSFRSIREAQR